METFVAFADYIATNENELGLCDADVVDVLNRENVDWWYGRNRTSGKEVRVVG